MSRAPTRQQQYIPPFSLWWIGMVHDYWWYVDDPGFVREMLPGVRAVLDYFQALQKSNGSLGRVPFWNYVDWTSQWPGGVPPRADDGGSALLDLQLLMALDWAADLEDALASRARGSEYRKAASVLRKTIREMYWDGSRKFLADTPKKDSFSQQANALAVLAGVTTGAEARDLILRALVDTTLVQCGYYFRYYLHAAVVKVGEGNRYLDLLQPWDEMMKKGLTTWAERPEGSMNPSRSDCHAWGSSPNIELFRTVLGIDSAAAGFKHVVIRPHPGRLTHVTGSIPHPKGDVRVSLMKQGTKWTLEVTLPEGIAGEVEWAGKRLPMRGSEGRWEFP